VSDRPLNKLLAELSDSHVILDGSPYVRISSMPMIARVLSELADLGGL